MSKIMRAQLLCAIAAVVGSTSCMAEMGASQQADLLARTPDGRFGTKCYLSGDGKGTELCAVSFYKLIASPERFHGKLVGVSGFLANVFSKPVLFPNRQSYEASAFAEGITLQDAQIPPEILTQLDAGVWPVVVFGVFDGKFTGYSEPRLGALKQVRRVFVAPPPDPTGGEE